MTAPCPHCSQPINIEELKDRVSFDCPACGGFITLYRNTAPGIHVFRKAK